MVYDLKLLDLYQLVHMLLGPVEAPKWMQEAKWQNL